MSKLEHVRAMMPTSRVWLSAASALLLWAGAAAAATPSARTDAGTRADAREQPGPVLTDMHNATSLTGASLLVSSFAQQGPSTASADAAADLGFLHAQAFATFPAAIAGDASATASAGWTDFFTINVPGHTGELAQIQAIALIDGFLDRTGDGVASMRIGARVNGGNTGPFQFDSTANGLFGGGVPLQNLPEFLTINGSFIIGTPFEVSMSLVAGVGARTGDTPGSADSFFSDTVTWGGIQSLTLNGATIDDFTFNSFSGLDYTRSFLDIVPPPPGEVPEPGSLPLLAMALILGGVFARRQLVNQLD